jgi:hypothetical protein
MDTRWRGEKTRRKGGEIHNGSLHRTERKAGKKTTFGVIGMGGNSKEKSATSTGRQPADNSAISSVSVAPDNHEREHRQEARQSGDSGSNS